jgi:hypothetical protein
MDTDTYTTLTPTHNFTNKYLPNTVHAVKSLYNPMLCIYIFRSNRSFQPITTENICSPLGEGCLRRCLCNYYLKKKNLLSVGWNCGCLSLPWVFGLPGGSSPRPPFLASLGALWVELHHNCNLVDVSGVWTIIQIFFVFFWGVGVHLAHDLVYQLSPSFTFSSCLDLGGSRCIIRCPRAARLARPGEDIPQTKKAHEA